ncbi:MAG: 2-oxo acid dehydrogenase subunit E2, partial [Phycisphaerales bacterium]|nr:2-oxo acid dehydrogenase subunit E2 [Phycisphaerales bacterium]
MATDIVIPAVGESITEGVIAAWLKSDGDYVERDEDIVEIETDKVTQALPAPVSGVLKQGVSEGETVEVGAVIGAIDESAAAPAKSEKQEAKAEPVAAAAASSAKAAPAKKSEPAPAAPSAKPAASSPAPGGGDDARSTPLAQRLAAEHGVSLNGIAGTGPGGRIREQDVLAYIQSHRNGSAAPATSAPAAPGSRNVRRERMSPLRQRIATRLVEAQHTAAMLTTFNECDMTNVMALRSRMKDTFADTHGVKLGFMSFFMKAAVSALRKFPNVNAFIAEGEKGPEIEHHDYCDIAVAVGTDKGLVV